MQMTMKICCNGQMLWTMTITQGVQHSAPPTGTCLAFVLTCICSTSGQCHMDDAQQQSVVKGSHLSASWMQAESLTRRQQCCIAVCTCRLHLLNASITDYCHVTNGSHMLVKSFNCPPTYSCREHAMTAAFLHAGPGARWHLPQCLSLLAPSKTMPNRTVNHGQSTQ